MADSVSNGDDLVAAVRAKRKKARDHWEPWRKEAKEAYDLVAGRQWDEAAQEVLKSEKRPPVVFNRVAVTIDSVCGSEAQNRQAVHYYPRELGDVGVNELLTNAAAWVRDRSNADIEENEAFRDALICGLGVTETRMNYDENPDGEIEIERIDPFEVYPDPAARKRNLIDGNYVIRERWVGSAAIEAQWPGRVKDLATESEGEDDARTPVDATGQDYDGADDEANYRPRTDEYRLVECQHRTMTPYWRMLDPQTQKIVDVPADKWKLIERAAKENGIPLQAVPARRWEWRRTIICGEVLLEDGPAPSRKMCSIKFVTGLRDRNKRLWYGMVRVMKDPQQWANKFLSQILHIINSNAKGGVLYELNAFADPKQAERDWAKPDAMIPLNAGGLMKVQQRPPIQYPAGLDALMQLSVSTIRDSTGVNLEMLGLADRQQAGVLESQRKQAALTVLAQWFDALRAYRREQGRLLFDFINRYISDGRLIRIDGENGKRYAPLVRQPDTIEYDVIVDSAPSSVNVKQQTFETLQALMPAMMKAGVPIPPSTFKYLPIPESLAAEWAQMSQGGGVPPEVQQQIEEGKQQMQQMGEQLAQREAEAMKMQAEIAQKDIALAQAKAAAASEGDRALIEAEKVKVDAAKVAVEQFKAETERMRAEWDATQAEAQQQQQMIDSVMNTKQMAEQHESFKTQEMPKLMQQHFTQSIGPLLEQLRQQIAQDAEKRPIALEYGADGRISGVNGRKVKRDAAGRLVSLQ